MGFEGVEMTYAAREERRVALRADNKRGFGGKPLMAWDAYIFEGIRWLYFGVFLAGTGNRCSGIHGYW